MHLFWTFLIYFPTFYMRKGRKLFSGWMVSFSDFYMLRVQIPWTYHTLILLLSYVDFYYHSLNIPTYIFNNSTLEWNYPFAILFFLRFLVKVRKKCSTINVGLAMQILKLMMVLVLTLMQMLNGHDVTTNSSPYLSLVPVFTWD